MTDESGDVENPTVLATGALAAAGGAANKNWKLIALSAILIVAGVLAITLSMTIGQKDRDNGDAFSQNMKNNNDETINDTTSTETFSQNKSTDNNDGTIDQTTTETLFDILIGPTWYVVEFLDENRLVTPVPESTIALKFEEDGQIRGYIAYTGCNNSSYTAGYTDLTDSSFKIEGNMAISPNVYCNGEIGEQESLYLQLFKGRGYMSNDELRSPIIDYIITEDGTLELRDGDTVIARYTTTIPETSEVASQTEPGSVTEDNITPAVFEVHYLQSVRPIAARVRVANPAVANGYNSCLDLRDDILNALKWYANSIIVGEIDNDWFQMCGLGDSCIRDDVCKSGNCDEGKCVPGERIPYSPTESPTSGATPTVGIEPEDAIPENSYDTNTQVQGVDEADAVKANADYVFAAYGDILWTWNSTDASEGRMSMTKMPQEPRDPNCAEPPTWAPRENWQWPTYSPTDSQPRRPSPSPTEDTQRDRRNLRQREVSTMGGYNSCYKPKPQILSLLLAGPRLTVVVYEPEWLWDPNIIFSDDRMIIRVYDAKNVPTDGGPLTLLGEQDIKGSYTSARSIGPKGVVISQSHINTWPLVGKLYRYNSQYCGLNSTEYEKFATETALSMVDQFTEQIVDELALQLDGTCDNFFQIAAMQSGNRTDAPSGNILSELVRVTTFDMSSDFASKRVSLIGETPKIPINVAGAFASGYSHTVYASQDFVASVSNGEYGTFIQGFDISGTTPRPFSYAELSGALLNQYSLDLYQNHLRVVTTQSQWWPERKTLNKLWVLKLPDRGPDVAVTNPKMKLTGETGHIGKPNEEVFAVRFMEDMVYVVTFEQTDPFYILNVTDHTNPTIVGELQIPGFSSYLHPIQINGVNLMIGVGRHVDPVSGSNDGAKISLFDVSNPTNPKENATFIDMGAYSSAGNDFYSFRYLNLNQKLILPKSKYTWSDRGNFDGFIVYDVKLGSITPSYEIKHADSSAMYHGCWYEARMPARSLVFQSQLTTILSHSVISTDLATGVQNWNVSLDEGLNKTQCRGYFW